MVTWNWIVVDINGRAGYALSLSYGNLNKLSVLRLNICLEIFVLGYRWRIAIVVVEIA